jgi:hypothetical protein
VEKEENYFNDKLLVESGVIDPSSYSPPHHFREPENSQSISKLFSYKIKKGRAMV